MPEPNDHGKSQPHLFAALLSRRSVRRYAPAPLDPPAMEQVRTVISGVEPLLPGNHFHVLQCDVAPGEDLIETLGGYGRIVSPPHYLVPYAIGQAHLLLELGYCTEQIAVHLAGLGIGTCFIASLGREDVVRARFGLPEAARIAAFLIFGRPAAHLRGRAFNAAVRLAAGATNKLPPGRIFFHETFENPTAPPPELANLIEAARNAPSAANAQPWRFLWRDGVLYLFVLRHSRRYGPGIGALFRFFDGGICMANVTLALQAFDLSARWHILLDTDPHLPQHPATLQPLAKLHFAQTP